MIYCQQTCNNERLKYSWSNNYILERILELQLAFDGIGLQRPTQQLVAINLNFENVPGNSISFWLWNLDITNHVYFCMTFNYMQDNTIRSILPRNPRSYKHSWSIGLAWEAILTVLFQHFRNVTEILTCCSTNGNDLVWLRDWKWLSESQRSCWCLYSKTTSRRCLLSFAWMPNDNCEMQRHKVHLPLPQSCLHDIRATLESSKQRGSAQRYYLRTSSPLELESKPQHSSYTKQPKRE